MKNKAVFFDRDGVINKRLIDDYVKSPEEFILNDEIPEIISLVKKNDYLLILITNQQGIGKGIMNIFNLEKIHNYMQNNLINLTGYQFDDIYFSSDLADSNSFRRKPNPGMLLEAIEKWDIDTSKSFMIGDSDSDILAGQKAGVSTILVKSGHSNSSPDYHVANLNELMSLLSKDLLRCQNA
jgi:D-glycero-D-manno-heptose 1,7-bisphosphate phosphatase